MPVTTVLVIAIRIVISTSLNKPFLTSLLDTAQTVNLGVSFITNLIATSIISLKAWWATILTRCSAHIMTESWSLIGL